MTSYELRRELEHQISQGAVDMELGQEVALRLPEKQHVPTDAERRAG